MTLVMGDLCSALIATSASEENSMAAAMEVAAHRSRSRSPTVPVLVLVGITGVVFVLTLLLLTKMLTSSVMAGWGVSASRQAAPFGTVRMGDAVALF